MATNSPIYEENYERFDEVNSRFMNLNPKKYLLAGVDQSVDQLSKDQIDSLTKLLISLKSDYDNLIREVSKKKGSTEEIAKQITMIERMGSKFRSKVLEMEDQTSSYEMNIELQKKRLEEEIYARGSYTHLIGRIKEDLHIIKKEINDKESGSVILLKKLEKERFKESLIKIELNKIHSQIQLHTKKNQADRNEKELIIEYYNTIINQKRSYIHEADERKLNQERIAEQAKNDTQDKQEVEKRKLLNLCKLYNKFLRKKTDSYLLENSNIEKTYQKIKSITVSLQYYFVKREYHT